MLDELYDMLSAEGVTLEVTEDAKQKIAELGYSPTFGARPLRRAIQEHLEDKIADHMYNEPEAKQLMALVEGDVIKIVNV